MNIVPTSSPVLASMLACVSYPAWKVASNKSKKKRVPNCGVTNSDGGDTSDGAGRLTATKDTIIKSQQYP